MASPTTEKVISFIRDALPQLLNYGGALLIVAGICLLPIVLALKLILLGVFSIATYYAFR